MQTLVPLNGDDLDHWTWMERRDFLNWCLDEQVLTIVDGRLMPFEEGTPTAELNHDSEETGFLHDVERAKPVMHDNPEISAKGLADALRLKSVVYAHKSDQEGV